ncbi:hypothetical protein I203_103072 [Kwoniella mangroviensis CBS 8507]|uniref:uncharacterized protein n=1 Tax=Kwoniella mangroviensis CBS 8507 TaxID=1296122 RepID=UPI00305A6620
MDTQAKPEKVKRGYRACRKAKCDLGDIDAPSSPPCSRCKRESRECVFAPSRRGGNNRKRETKESSEEQSISYPPHTSPTPSPKRRRLHLNPPLHDADPSSIVVADMQNESDALQILALASGQAATKESIVGGRGKRNQEIYMHEKSGQATTVNNISDFKRFYERRRSDQAPVLENFPLIKLGVLSAEQAIRLVDRYFRYYHHLTSLRRYSRISRDSRQGLGHNENVQSLGAPPTIGLVESLLLLAENLPRSPPLVTPIELNPTGAREEPHGDENRQGWQLIGLAVRSAYELGLDKMALRILSDSERTLEIERARVAWTYRHVSIRLGKGFWARGAAVCFQGFSSSAQSGPSAGFGNFPFLRGIPDDQEHPQEDYGNLIQAYLELTQLMSNAHDTLYPNAARTRSLVIHGEYFKYLDEQAHVERATIRAEEEYRTKTTTSLKLSLFPRGAAQSPDARYIFHMCDAAREILTICVDKLHPGGALPYLPTRHVLWFTYAAIVLLKALYSGAMLRGDHQKTFNLIDKLCHCLSQTSVDPNYPAVRYGRQLESLRKKLAVLSDANTTPNTLPDSRVNHDWDGSELYRDSTYQPMPPMHDWGNAPPTNTAPYAQQPMSDIGSGSYQGVEAGFGLASTYGPTDNLFGFISNWQGDGMPQAVGETGEMDLGDFWVQAQGGFPFR